MISCAEPLLEPGEYLAVPDDVYLSFIVTMGHSAQTDSVALGLAYITVVLKRSTYSAIMMSAGRQDTPG